MKLFFTSEEVCGHFEIPASTLEHYIQFFKLKIGKVGKNRRFNHADMDLLGKILQLVNKEGFTLEGAKEKLKSKTKQSNNKTEIIQSLEELKKLLEMLKTTTL